MAHKWNNLPTPDGLPRYARPVDIVTRWKAAAPTSEKGIQALNEWCKIHLDTVIDESEKNCPLKVFTPTLDLRLDEFFRIDDKMKKMQDARIRMRMFD